jgi:hypothetical protein
LGTHAGTQSRGHAPAYRWYEVSAPPDCARARTRTNGRRIQTRSSDATPRPLLLFASRFLPLSIRTSLRRIRSVPSPLNPPPPALTALPDSSPSPTKPTRPELTPTCADPRAGAGTWARAAPAVGEAVQMVLVHEHAQEHARRPANRAGRGTVISSSVKSEWK